MNNQGFIRFKSIIAFLITICGSIWFTYAGVNADSPQMSKYINGGVTALLYGKPWLFVLFLAAVILLIIYLKHKIINKTNHNISNELFCIGNLKATFFNMGNGIVVTDINRNIMYLNPAAEELCGYSKKDAINKNLTDILKLYDINDGGTGLEKAIDFEDEIGFNAIIVSQNEISCTVSLTINKMFDEKCAQLGYIILVQNIDSSNKNVKLDGELVELNYDNLTVLPNRKLFYDYLNIAVSDAEAVGRKLALLFIDLDLFKDINDTFGHCVGDELLKQAASRLLEAADKDNDAVARMGGDEFAILLTKFKDDEHVYSIAQNILDIFSSPFMIDTHELYISASIGIAIYPGHGNDTHSILKNAASSMYKAKEMGRNNYQAYTPDININTLHKFTMQKSLRYALERNELLLHYQPKVNGKTGKLVGIEALVRWQHPERGLIYPAEFIPLAEETGFIKQIDEWVLKTACMQLKKWAAKGHSSLRLAVNLSAWQFKEQHLADIVADVLKETGVNPSELELEITETAAMENLNFTVNTLGKLMAMGVNISIDDFGTGYSSLNYLKHFPINFLKIDRSFISDILDDKNTCAIVRAIIEVAHTLNLKVIAEGVETQDQLKILQSMGCDEIQGFYISRPLPVDELENRMIK